MIATAIMFWLVKVLVFNILGMASEYRNEVMRIFLILIVVAVICGCLFGAGWWASIVLLVIGVYVLPILSNNRDVVSWIIAGIITLVVMIKLKRGPCKDIPRWLI